MTVRPNKIPPFLVIIGPTASGKSGVAHAVAGRLGGDVLAVDSMTIYRGMDVGTAKPTAAERAAVPYHLIDVADAAERYTVARFVESADAVIADTRARGRPLVATGGTPLYFKALFDGLFDGPGTDTALRERLSAEPGGRLHERLTRVDPAAAERIHANDFRRLVRALEVFELTGRPISSFQQEWSAGKRRHDAAWFGLAWDKDALNRRINARVKQMVAAGWLDETRALLDGGGLSETAAGATGYSELAGHLRGNATLDDAVERIKISTRQLARRQVKWFRRFPDVTWLAGDRPIDEVADDIVRSVGPK